MLLSRDEFRNRVFERDSHQCVICKAPAKDAHHIIERRLFPDGGYYLDNGASVCEEHHLAAERTTLSCDEVRTAAGIKNVVLPPHLYPDEQYDKWGNPILPNGQRLRGELFDDPSVQKIIEPALHLFTNRVKHPRTHHFPWSPGINSDDRVLRSLDGFAEKRVIASVKMDGEQTSIYRDGFHARSIDSASHPSRDWLWGIHRQIGHEIPEGWRVCGENLYAQHSIAYKNLRAHFLVFSIWNEKNECLSWDDTVVYAAVLGLKMVPVIYDGLWNEEKIKNLYTPTHDGDECEGYVVRVADAFHYRQHAEVVGKYVRKGHVQTHGHWMRQAVVVNGLKNLGE